MVVMFRMSPEKREKYIKKLDKMMDFIEEFKECLEDSEEESSYRHEDYDGDEEYVKVPKSHYARMMKRSKMG
jgi:Asp-tRNA(Asn)/Glu-tRNA(Gln) amidotransferase C subunit